MDFKVLKNPYVLGGGVVIGLLVLMTSGGGATDETPAADAGLAYANLGLQRDLAAMNLISRNAEASLARDSDLDKNNTAKYLGVLNLLDSNRKTNAQVAMTMAAVNASIAQTRIQNMTAVLIDQADNNARLVQGYTEAGIARYSIDGQVMQTALNGWTARDIAKTQASVAKKQIKATKTLGLFQAGLSAFAPLGKAITSGMGA